MPPDDSGSAHAFGFDHAWIDGIDADVPGAELAKGTRIKVRWSDGETYPAIVKDSWYGLHFVHYVDFGAEYDDWVSMDQIAR